MLHQVFHTSNVERMILSTPPARVPELIECLVYEADQRLRHPVRGCTRALDQLGDTSRRCREDHPLDIRGVKHLVEHPELLHACALDQLGDTSWRCREDHPLDIRGVKHLVEHPELLHACVC
ncbi:hypothetical protein L6452_41403 [Arctium lappa]|uniref:Uncharacterized protein n=1 Tax=Arctium lappa TaxID=4217 RepID=A0ACB8XNY4_ARCLA|nr:hypothetical protein L6452_41403 [Arctium lappa]